MNVLVFHGPAVGSGHRNTITVELRSHPAGRPLQAIDCDTAHVRGNFPREHPLRDLNDLLAITAAPRLHRARVLGLEIRIAAEPRQHGMF